MKFNWRRFFNFKILDTLILHAQSLAFDTLLALVPLLVVMFAIFKGFGGLQTMQFQLEEWLLKQFLATPELSAQIHGYLHKFSINLEQSQTNIVSIVLLIYSVVSLMSHIENAFNQIFECDKSRSWSARLVTYWAILTLGPICMAVSIALTSGIDTSKFSHVISWLLTYISFGLMYRGIPQTKVTRFAAWTSALLAGTLWNIAKLAYAAYAKSAVSWQNVYGSLAVIPLFILWLYISWALVLLGATWAHALNTRDPQLTEDKK